MISRSNKLRGLILALLTLTSAALGAHSAELLTRERAEAMLDRLPLTSVEGLWQMTDDGTTILIVRADTLSNHPMPMLYDIMIVESDNHSLLPGTSIGRLTPLAQPLTYDGHITLPSASGIERLKEKRFTLKLEDEAHLSLRHIKSGVHISPTVLVPWGYRISVKIGTNRKDNLDGCIKVYPLVPVKGAPRYL